MFWDSSALIPYLVWERWSSEGTAVLSEDLSPTIWWCTPVECISALWRKEREGDLEAVCCEEAFHRLVELVRSVDIVEAHPAVRDRAMRLLALHPLQAADAMQLAAALVYCGERTFGESFACLDPRLREAARREGFIVVPEELP